MTATERMEKIVTEKYGVQKNSPFTLQTLFLRQMAMAEVIEEQERRIEILERGGTVMDGKDDRF